jgi:type IV secretory pathway VirB10-like protein
MRGNRTYQWVLVTDVRELMDRPRPRHVDRRDQGLRRQRMVTQGATFGAAALAVAFGWVFAQPTEAPATEPAGSTEKIPATKAPATKAPGKAPTTKAPGKQKQEQPAAEESEEPELKAPEEPPAEEPEREQEQQPDARSGGS